MAKGLKSNREQHKSVERMNHKQLVGIKGVGTKKAAKIMEAVSKLYEGGEKEWER